MMRKVFAAVGATCVVLSLSLALMTALTPTPTFDELRTSTLGSESTLLSRNGEPLQRLRVDMTRRQLEWTALDSISPSLVRAVVAAEDHRFWWHFGFDPASGLSAFIDQFGNGRGRGASTITMQLAGLMIEGDRFGRRSLDEKLAQFRYAVALEHRWSKQQIIEAYLNLVPLRGELVGIRAASLGLFGHAPDAFDEAESAVIAALVRSPSASRSVVARRACAVMAKMDRAEECARAELAASTLPSYPLAMSGLDEAPHLARRLLTRAGTSVRSTLDAPLQRFAAETLRNRLASLSERNVEDGAVIVLDNATGDVLAYVGSSGDLSGAAAVDGAAALRQPGSTLKPFLYGVAIEQRWLTAASLLDDAPLALTTPSGLYVPQNYERDFKGAVSVRSALAASLNVPAVRTLQLVGLERFRQTLQAFGMSSVKHDGEYYGYGLALGGGDTSLLALTNAYRALANGGVWSPAYLQIERAQRRWWRRGSRAFRRGELHRVRHPGRFRRACIDVRARKPVVDALMGRSENRHQQGHARQLGDWLYRPVHGRCMGRKFFRRADVGRVGRDRRGADLARDRRSSACWSAEPCAECSGRRRAARRCLRARSGTGTPRVVRCEH